MELRELRRLSAEHELSLNYVAKDLMISRALFALKDVPGIVFKGGTAINRIHLKKLGRMRFSEDIDVDYDSQKGPKQMVASLGSIVKENLGFFNLARPRIMKDIVRFDLGYTNPLGRKDKIRLEFKITEVDEKSSKQVVNYGFVPHDSALLRVYDKEVLVQHKARCVLARKDARDIYDLYYLLPERLEFDKRIRERLIRSLEMGRDEMRSMADSLNHFIPRSKRPVFQDLLEGLKEKLAM